MAGTLLCTTPVFPRRCYRTTTLPLVEGSLFVCLPNTRSLACSCPLGAGCGISTGLRMALLGLLGDTKGRKPSLNPPTSPLCSVSRATGRSCSSQIMAQHAFKGLRVHHYPYHRTPILRGAMASLAGGRLGWTDPLCTGLALSTWLPVPSGTWFIWPLGCLYPDFLSI